MKIGVDIRVLMDQNYSGISEYVANVLLAILRLENDNNNEYKLFYNSFKDISKKLDIWNKDNSETIYTKWSNKFFNYFLQKIIKYPRLDKKLGGVDIFWSPHFNFSAFSKSNQLKKVVTVHDLSFIRYPEFFNKRKNFWHKLLNVKKIILESDHIVAISENTKNDIIELFNIDESRVSVIYSGNNTEKHDISDNECRNFLLKNNISSDYIFFLGNIEPRKNIKGLIKAYELFRDKNIGGKKYQLVLAGQRAWRSGEIFSTWEKSKYKDDILFLGYINKKEKEILYSKSSLFVYPSFYEGFGLPPLEAMTYGVPVVTSCVSSLPEVVGDAAVLVNPNKIEEIAEAMYEILNDKNLAEDLKMKSLERAKFFSWEKTAKDYINLFNKLNNER